MAPPFRTGVPPVADRSSLISGAPSEVEQDWFLTNEMKAAARARVNKEAGSRRMLSHAIFS